MPVICHKCKNKTALVKGTFYFDADEEPYESGERIELHLDGEQRIHGHYCEECNVMIELWDDEREAEHYEKQVDEDEIKLRDHFAGLAIQGLLAINDNRHYTDYEYIAIKAYSVADAMLKARKEVKP